MATVDLREVRKSFDTVEVIRGVNLTVSEGEFVVFVGPSGCGKSTLLRLIAGLETITSGEVAIDGQRCNDLPPSERGIAMVFQSYALYPHMSVFDNMAFALKLAHMRKDEIKSRVERAAGILQIGALLGRKPKALSGGQRQRVAIGRAIVREPKVFLFDEPLSNLDAALRVQMRIEIARLHKDLKTTIVYVTHDQVEAMTMASRIVVLNAGLVEQVGAPLELYHRPNNRFVAGFIGSPKMNFLPGTLVSAEPTRAHVALRCGAELTCAVDATRAAKGAELSVGIRPEHFRLPGGAAEAPGELGQLRGEVALVENLGESALIYVRLPDTDGLTLCRIEGNSLTREGERIELGVPSGAVHVFDADGRAFPRTVDALPGAERRAS
ncbi:MAG TPA: sn-glycerol-3-phosphate ABC transporter ATP-binding protein UgpC [Kofleriaceae bacterium]|jgi:multiple sugar transport system ATP-binding protein|nr:sn-glycerol-3-phosphate ABC transporter ATP-binding protein UgpC [Kofleriaceae bacterium]